MDTRIRTIVDDEVFDILADRYNSVCGLGVALICDNEVVRNEDPNYPWSEGATIPITFARMIQEAARWGEPHILMDRNETFVWCVPVFCNNAALGGVFSSHTTPEADAGTADVQKAAWTLLELAEELNVCNRGHMQLSRLTARTKARQAEAIQLSKRVYYRDPRDVYLIEERRLLNAIRSGNVATARSIVNRILVGIYHRAGRDFEALKPLVLEIVLHMYRSAVDEGADPADLSGLNGSVLADLLSVDNEYDMSRWLTQWLELFVNADLGTRAKTTSGSVAPAILYIKNNFHRPLTRDQVAGVCNVSPGHFSRLFRSSTGYTFTSLVNRFRIERACALLETTQLSALEVAYSVGFSDQSYFTRVFKKRVGITPAAYRERHREVTAETAEPAQSAEPIGMYKTIDS